MFDLSKVTCNHEGRIRIPEILGEGTSSYTQKRQSLITPLPLEPQSLPVNPKVKKPDRHPPAIPTNLKVVSEGFLAGIKNLEKNLRSLNDAQLMKRATQLSPTTNKQIVEWQQERQRMFISNYSTADFLGKKWK